MKTTRKALSAVLEGPRKIGLKEFPVPQIGPKEGLLKVEMVGICGSDVSYYKGKVKPDALPLIMGHETVGHVEEIGEEAKANWGVSKGERVVVETIIRCGKCRYCIEGNYRFCEQHHNYGHGISCSEPPHLWGSYGQYMYLAPNSMLHKISDAVPPEEAVLINAVIANGIQWVGRIAGVTIGDTVVIQGCGPQGLAATIAAKEGGASLVIITGLSADEEQGRFRLAQRFGANYIINVEKEDVVQRVKEITQGRMGNIVMDVTGNPKAVARSLELVCPQGTVLCAGIAGMNTVTPIITDLMIFNEIRFRGVFSKDEKAIRAAIRLVESRKYPFSAMVTHKYPLSQVDEALRVAGGEVAGAKAIKVALSPWS